MIGLLVVGLAAVALVVWIAGVLLLHSVYYADPDRQRRDRTPADLGLVHEPLAVTTEDGLSLVGWYLPGTRDTVVVVSGGGRRPPGETLGMCAGLQRSGFHVVTFGWRGTVGCDAARHTQGVWEQRDMTAAVAATRRRVGDMPMVMLGLCLGAIVSINHAADDPSVRAVCADSPITSPVDLLYDTARRRTGFLRPLFAWPVVLLVRLRTGAWLTKMRPVDRIMDLSPRPLLLMYSRDDPIVPRRRVEAMFNRAREPKRLEFLMADEHARAYRMDREGYMARVVGFFDEALSGSLHVAVDQEVSAAR